MSDGNNGNSCRLVMSMGNYLYARRVRMDVMSASTHPVGLDHLTVVPENFDPDADDNETDEES
jgi:hypothetical protein